MKPHELIADPKRWCTKTWAKTADGREVSWIHPEAVSFCMSGAVAKYERITQTVGDGAWIKLLHFCWKVFGHHPSYVNDHYGHAIAVETLRLCFKGDKPR